ncbi:MAG: FkbM family methyltransferase [Rudaea sp.]|nr:FkbM family methyltransferase [Rudaea sp.]
MQRCKNMSIRSLVVASYRNPVRALSRLLQVILSPLLRIATIWPLATKNSFMRECVFHALQASKKLDLFYVGGYKESFLVNSKDRIISRDIYIKGEFDFLKFDTAAKLLKKHGRLTEGGIDILVDVGANIGSICIPAVARGYAKTAIAIEPHPENCRILRANIALNRLNQLISVHELAVGVNKDDVLKLDISHDNWGDHRIASKICPQNKTGIDSISVKSTNLDSMISKFDNVNILLWMDIQGYEGYALEGAEKLVEKKIPMVIEFWPHGMQRSGCYSTLRRLLDAYVGFYDLDVPISFHPISDLDVLYERIARNDGFTDLLVI